MPFHNEQENAKLDARARCMGSSTPYGAHAAAEPTGELPSILRAEPAQGTPTPSLPELDDAEDPWKSACKGAFIGILIVIFAFCGFLFGLWLYDSDNFSFTMERAKDNLSLVLPIYDGRYDDAQLAVEADLNEDGSAAHIGDSYEPLSYYSVLDDAGRDIYDVFALMAHRAVHSDPILFSGTGYEPTERMREAIDSDYDVMEVFAQSFYDHPLHSMFKCGNDRTYVNVSNDARMTMFSDAVRQDEDTLAMYDQARQKAEQIRMQIKGELGEGYSQKQYIYAVYDYLSETIAYSDDVDDTIHANDIYGALLEGESKCYGMSCAMKYLLDLEGIPCFVASGEQHKGDVAGEITQGMVDEVQRAVAGVTQEDLDAVSTLQESIMGGSANKALTAPDAKGLGDAGAAGEVTDSEEGDDVKKDDSDRPLRHAWNVLPLNGEWVVCDVTVGSRIWTEEEPPADMDSLEGHRWMAFSHQAALQPQEDYLAERAIEMDAAAYALESHYEEEVGLGVKQIKMKVAIGGALTSR